MITKQSTQTAQSESIGLILIFALVVTSVGIILVTGLPAISTLQSNAQTERVVNEFSNLDADISTVTFGGSKARQVNLNTGEGQLEVDNGSGWVNITHYPVNASNRTIYNRSLGQIRYESSDGEIVAYQGGGVWTTQNEPGSGSGIVSPPEFRFRGSTLTFPIINITSDTGYIGQATSGGLTVSREGVDNIYPDKSSGYRNPIDNGTVNVTIKSDYYDAWADYFEQRTAGSVVEVNDAKQIATVELSIEASTTFDDGILGAGAGANKLDFGNQADVVTYNSTDGVDLIATYGGDPDIQSQCSMGGSCNTGLYSQGKIRSTGEVNVVSPQSKVFASLVSKDDITVDKGEVNGDIISAETATETGSGTVYGDIESNENVSIDSQFPPNPIIDKEISDASSSNNNGAYSCITGNSFTNACTDATLSSDGLGSNTSGDETIYLQGPTQVNGELEFDLEGNLTIAVDGPLTFDADTRIDDFDDANDSVTWYVRGDLSVTQGNVDVESDDDQSAFRNLFLVSGSQVTIEQQGRFEGAVYAPQSTLIAGNQRNIYGAIIVGDFDAGNLNKVQVFYDTDLKGREITILEPDVAITYLHVTENRVSIE